MRDQVDYEEIKLSSWLSRKFESRSANAQNFHISRVLSRPSNQSKCLIKVDLFLLLSIHDNYQRLNKKFQFLLGFMQILKRLTICQFLTITKTAAAAVIVRLADKVMITTRNFMSLINNYRRFSL
jgi:hypothetical protein